ncbi:unnamed protein product [Jaminaea pallidilutea]
MLPSNDSASPAEHNCVPTTPSRTKSDAGISTTHNLRTPRSTRRCAVNRAKTLSDVPATAAATPSRDHTTAESTPSNSPPRPPNAWILYRSYKLEQLKQQQDGNASAASSENKHRSASPAKGALTASALAALAASSSQDGSSFQTPRGNTPSLISDVTSSHAPTTPKTGSIQQSNSAAAATHLSTSTPISTLLAQLWKSEPEDVKASFHDLAKTKEEEHKKTWPNYKYKPRDTVKSRAARERRRKGSTTGFGSVLVESSRTLEVAAGPSDNQTLREVLNKPIFKAHASKSAVRNLPSLVLGSEPQLSPVLPATPLSAREAARPYPSPRQRKVGLPNLPPSTLHSTPSPRKVSCSTTASSVDTTLDHAMSSRATSGEWHPTLDVDTDHFAFTTIQEWADPAATIGDAPCVGQWVHGDVQGHLDDVESAWTGWPNIAPPGISFDMPQWAEVDHLSNAEQSQIVAQYSATTHIGSPNWHLSSNHTTAADGMVAPTATAASGSTTAPLAIDPALTLRNDDTWQECEEALLSFLATHSGDDTMTKGAALEELLADPRDRNVKPSLVKALPTSPAPRSPISLAPRKLPPPLTTLNWRRTEVHPSSPSPRSPRSPYSPRALHSPRFPRPRAAKYPLSPRLVGCSKHVASISEVVATQSQPHAVTEVTQSFQQDCNFGLTQSKSALSANDQPATSSGSERGRDHDSHTQDNRTQDKAGKISSPHSAAAFELHGSYTEDELWEMLMKRRRQA